MFLWGLKTNILLYIIQNSFLTKYPYVLLIYFSIHITRSISHNYLHILPYTSYKLHIPQSTYTRSSYILQSIFPQSIYTYKHHISQNIYISYYLHTFQKIPNTLPRANYKSPSNGRYINIKY